MKRLAVIDSIYLIKQLSLTCRVMNSQETSNDLAKYSTGKRDAIADIIEQSSVDQLKDLLEKFFFAGIDCAADLRREMSLIQQNKITSEVFQKVYEQVMKGGSDATT